MMGADAMTTALLAGVSSVVVGAVLLGLRRAGTHRDETTAHTAAIAVLQSRLEHIDTSVERIADTIDRIERKVDTLPCSECTPVQSSRAG